MCKLLTVPLEVLGSNPSGDVAIDIFNPFGTCTEIFIFTSTEIIIISVLSLTLSFILSSLTSSIIFIPAFV